MVHLEQAQPEQLQELLAFAEEAFRTPEGKVDFPTLLPKLYGPGADSAPLHTVLYEDGAPGRAVLPEDTGFQHSWNSPARGRHRHGVRGRTQPGQRASGPADAGRAGAYAGGGL